MKQHTTGCKPRHAASLPTVSDLVSDGRESGAGPLAESVPMGTVLTNERQAVTTAASDPSGASATAGGPFALQGRGSAPPCRIRNTTRPVAAPRRGRQG